MLLKKRRGRNNDETKVALKKKTKKARQEIADLLKQAADIVKKKE